MKERPILFSGPMVRAILAGQKTQTRRVVYVSPSVLGVPEQASPSCAATWHFRRADGKCEWHLNCRHGVPGDRLRVRETMRVLEVIRPNEVRIRYEADDDEVVVPYPARLAAPKVGKCLAYGGHREASRILLDLRSVRLERLHDISDADIAAEGVTVEAAVSLLGKRMPRGIALPASASAWTLRDAWRIGWSAINGAESWEANPWVWALSFQPVTPHPPEPRP